MKSPNSQVLTISDFTPGIYSNGNFATNVSPTPLGAAQETNTYRCISLPGGGLAPLPKKTNNYTIPWPGSGTVGTIVGLQALHIGGSTDNSADGDAVHVIIDANSSPRTAHWRAIETVTNAWSSITFATTNYPPDDATGNASLSLNANTTVPVGCSSDITRLSYNAGVSDARMVIFNFPSHISRMVFMYKILSALVAQRFQAATAMTFSHQGRVVGFSSYDVGHLPLTAVVNTVVNYSYPYFLTPTMVSSGTKFNLILDKASFFGSFGSVSVGELVLFSASSNDSIRILGDLTNPTVLLLRGVRATGRAYGRGVPISKGILYAVEKDGVYIWTGGSGSEKVSKQLRNNFWERTTDTGGYIGGTTSMGEMVHAQSWGDYVVYPNNFLLDVNSMSWWRLDNPTDGNYAIWSTEYPRYVYGAVDSIAAASTNTLVCYDMSVPATSFSWQSHPISIASYGQMVKVTDIEIKAIPSVADTNQTITITLTNQDNTTQAESFTINSKTNIPVRLRKPTVMRGWDIIVRIESDGGANPAPVIHSVSLGWQPSTPTAST